MLAQTTTAAARSGATHAVTGDPASADALNSLRAQVAAAQKARSAARHLDKALEAMQRGEFMLGRDQVEKALAADPGNGIGLHLLAICLEKMEDWLGALDAYEKALVKAPESPEIANDLGRLALRLGMLAQAEKLFRYHLAHRHNAPESATNLACVLREQMRFDEAIDLLKPVILANPDKAMLWNTLGTVISDMGDCEQAEIFFSEALRLEPAHAKALYNRANTLYTLGRTEQAVSDCRRAMALTTSPHEKASMGLALSSMLLASGHVSEGWQAYEARLSPYFHDPVEFRITRPRWDGASNLVGANLLLVGEQGLGDEVLFANIIPDVLKALGPKGRLSLAVEPRLVPLFQRSFPAAFVGPHATVKSEGRHYRFVPWLDQASLIDLYAPIGSPLAQLRPGVDAFPDRPNGFLKADPERIAYWRETLGALPGPRIGLVWTSMVISSSRRKYFAPFDRWGPILKERQASFVCLQYGDCAEDMTWAQRELGVHIHTPRGIDLKTQLDDLAALCSAMDLVLGPPNATSNIAAACGAPTWLITAPGAWPQLGTDRYPFYSQARVFASSTFGDWDPVIGEVAGALSDWLASPTGRR